MPGRGQIMIRYTLHCEAGHAFESWFASAAACDSLSKAGQLTCPECGTAKVDKTLMAPMVAKGSARATDRAIDQATDHAAALAELRRQVEANSEYVGMNFVAEARAMHLGDRPERSIYGEARPDEAIKLLEEGVPVAPLPFLPTRKAH